MGNDWNEEFKRLFLTQDGRGWVFKNGIVATGEDSRDDVIDFINQQILSTAQQCVEIGDLLRKQPILNGEWDKDEDGKPIVGTLKLNSKEFAYNTAYSKAISDYQLAIKKMMK